MADVAEIVVDESIDTLEVDMIPLLEDMLLDLREQVPSAILDKVVKAQEALDELLRGLTSIVDGQC